MISRQQVEAVARALCQEAGEDPDGTVVPRVAETEVIPNWKRYEVEARKHVVAFNTLVRLDRGDAHWLDHGEASA